jgi:hypothetical protein
MCATPRHVANELAAQAGYRLGDELRALLD